MHIPEKDERGAKTLGVSWSRLYEYTKCQQRLALHMQGKGDTVKDGRRFIHGTLADRAMRMWLEQKEEHLPGQMDKYVDQLWEDVVVNNPEYKITWKGDVKKDQNAVRALAKTVVNNVEPFLFKRVLPYDYMPEYRFKTPLRIPDQFGKPRTIFLRGGMDIIVREAEDKYSIYDLKATTNENYVHQGIMPQLIFYSIACTYEFGVQSEGMRVAFLTPACKQQYHELKLTAKDRKHLMTRIIKLAHAVWSEETPECTTDRNECYWCDVKQHCPLFATPLADASTDKRHRISIVDTANQRAQAKKATDIQTHEYDADKHGY